MLTRGHPGDSLWIAHTTLFLDSSGTFGVFRGGVVRMNYLIKFTLIDIL